MAVAFSASGQHYTDTAGLPGTVYTFTAWVRPATVGTRYRVVYWFRQTSGDHFSGIGIRDNPTDLQLMDDATYWFSGIGPLNASGGTWYQVAGVVNGIFATFYRSAAGSPLASTSVTDFTAPTPNQLWLGADAFGGWWEGRLASVKVWNAALTAAEVEAELAQYVPKRTQSLLRWHPLVRAETTDYSGNGFNLTGGTGATTEDGPPIPWGSAVPLVLTPSGGAAAVPVSGTAVTAATGLATARKVAVVTATTSLAPAALASARKTSVATGLASASATSTASSRKRAPGIGLTCVTASATAAARKWVMSAATGALAIASGAGVRKSVTTAAACQASATSTGAAAKRAPAAGTSSAAVWSYRSQVIMRAVTGLCVVGVTSRASARKVLPAAGQAALLGGSRVTAVRVAAVSGAASVALAGRVQAGRVSVVTARGVVAVAAEGGARKLAPATGRAFAVVVALQAVQQAAPTRGVMSSNQRVAAAAGWRERAGSAAAGTDRRGPEMAGGGL